MSLINDIRNIDPAIQNLDDLHQLHLAYTALYSKLEQIDTRIGKETGCYWYDLKAKGEERYSKI